MVIRCIDISDIRMCTSFRGKSQSSTSGSPPQFFSTFSASFVYSKVLSLGVSFFEREHRYRYSLTTMHFFKLHNNMECWVVHFWWSAMLSADLTLFGCHVFPINDQTTSQSEFSVTSTTLGHWWPFLKKDLWNLLTITDRRCLCSYSVQSAILFY